MKSRAFPFRAAKCLAGIAATLLLPAMTFAMDGFVVDIRHNTKPEGGIHDGSMPGKLLRYDIKDDKLAGTRVLYEEGRGVTDACLEPFGKRVVFSRPNGTMACISVDGGPVTELGRFLPADQVKPTDNAATGLQWPGTDGGRWVYFTGRDNRLKRVDVNTKAVEDVVQFNRGVEGEFALSMDATPNSGTFVKRTDNYAVVIYDMARGDGDLYSSPVWAPGCGISIAPDGSLFAANAGDHASVALVDVHANKQHSFRISEWDGDPTKGVKERAKLGWAWQSFRWATNDMAWISVRQGKLIGASTHEVPYTDAMLYNWVEKRQINLTNNKDGTFDRPVGMWVDQKGEQLLGYYRGEAPYSIALGDDRLKGDSWNWDFGDGSKGAHPGKISHTFQKEGVYNVVAQRGNEKFRAQVTVAPKRAPQPVVQFVNSNYLLVNFDEPVTGKGQVRLSDGTIAKEAKLSLTGRQLQVALAQPIRSGTTITLEGYTDQAQQPNPVAAKPLAVSVPAWPTKQDGLIYAWESARSGNLVLDPKSGNVNLSRLTGSFDRAGWLQLTGGGHGGTGIFCQSGAGQDFYQAVAANRFTMELIMQPAQQSQAAGPGGLPRRIINCSAWHAGDWEFMLGQIDNKVVCSIRTVDNFLDTDGKPAKDGLHGRAPNYDLFTVADTLPHHVVVTYEPGRLTGYLDGKKIVENTQVTGNLKWGYGELVFGGNHNGGSHRWLGRMRNMGLYARVLPPEEVQANYAAAQVAMKNLPQITVKAKLVAVTPVPTPESIAPYTEALVANDYQVQEIVKNSADWKGLATIAAGKTIRVYQWGIVQKKKTAIADLKAGEVRELTLEAYENHPGKLDEVVTSNDLDLAASYPSLYEP